MSRITLSLIIPAYNEEKKIRKDLKAAYSYLKKRKISAEVIVSCNSCSDNTEKIVKEFQREYKNLILLSTQKKLGKGGALKWGVKTAKGKYIMFADAGLCVPFKFIDHGLAALKNGAHVAVGSRALPGSIIKRRQPVYRIIGSRVFWFIFRFLMKTPTEIQDTQCGFKLFQHVPAKHLFGKLQTKGMIWDVELLLRAKKKKYKIVQFPVEWSNDADTKLNPIKHGIGLIQQLWAIKFKMKL